MNIETATIFRTWVEIADALKTDADRGKFYHAICRYALYGEIPDLPGILGTYFTLIRPSIDKSNRRKLAQQKGVQNRLQNNSQNKQRTDRQTDLQTDLQSDLQSDSQTDLQNGAARARKTGTGTGKKRVAKATPKETAVSFAALLPPHLNREPFLSKWHEWEEYRRRKRKPISTPALIQQLKLLSTLDIGLACAAIDNSIRNDYQGLFKPRGTEATAPAAGKDYNGI